MGFNKPRGFRDILFQEAARRERISADVSAYFAALGYELVETPSVEYPDNGVQNDIFRLTDVDGKLLALRSDVTGALARVVAHSFSLVQPPYRLRYRADVFREQESLRGSDRQLTQLGLECFGLEATQADGEVLRLALGGAEAAGIGECSLHISDVTVSRALADKEVSASKKLVELRGSGEVFERCRALVADDADAVAALSRLQACYEELVSSTASGQKVVVDFSLETQFDYYSGFTFELYGKAGNSRYRKIASGGRYDNLMEQFGRKMSAAGFSYDLASLEKVVSDSGSGSCGASVVEGDRRTPPLCIALPKGKLYDDCVALLRAAGVSVAGLENPGRNLRLMNDEYSILIAKPSDVAIYVSRGVADIGISGRDTLVEADFPLMQLADLGFGACEFVVAAPAATFKSAAAHESMGCSLDEMSLQLGTIRVATKYPRLTQSFFDQRGIQVEIVKLNGNIELAPLIGIADVVVDITQTGTTLRENDLRIVERVLPSTARFVAQHCAARTDERIASLVQKLEALVADGSVVSGCTLEQVDAAIKEMSTC